MANIIYGIGDAAPVASVQPRGLLHQQRVRADALRPEHRGPGEGRGPARTNAGIATTLHPLLDCVADMQVVYYLDTDGDGFLESPIKDIAAAFPAGSAAAKDARTS